LFPPIPAPAVPLDRQEQTAVLACQKVIARQTNQFLNKSYEQLERCGTDALALRLEEERELNSTNIGEYVRRREQIVQRCDTAFARIGLLSTRLITTIEASCEHVEDLILDLPSRGDPLGWKTLNTLLESLGEYTAAESVEEIGGLVCFSAMDHLEELLGGVLPRSGDLIRRYYTQDPTGDFVDYLHSFLDPRCTGILDS
jgi:hypothetical protein